MSSKSTQAVDPSNDGVMLVKAFPPAVYALPEEFVISFDVE
jgi:hypothetical protein